MRQNKQNDTENLVDFTSEYVINNNMKPTNPCNYKDVLTVEKLIKKLKNLPPNMNVCVRNKYVECDMMEDYAIEEGNAFEGRDEVFHIYF